jgi:peptidoglycan/xylan/chitin deacetylase (PgdA/CDA1 family)
MTRLDTGMEARVRARALPGAVALTFDDGPDPVWTPRVLAELSRLGATATFFVDARRARAHPELIAAITAGGHEVGFHCLDHVRHSELAQAEVGAEAANGLAMLASLGIYPTVWRAPWGVVTAATRRAASEHGLELWNWSFDSHDWRGDSREQMLDALSEAGGLADGAVVLMHDALGPGARRDGCAETVRLTVALLEAARSAGLRPAPLSARPAAVAA